MISRSLNYIATIVPILAGNRKKNWKTDKKR